MVRALPRSAAPLARMLCDKHPDGPSPLVAEEEFTGQAAGFPIMRETEVWQFPETPLPERHELWWDDGTAVPEFVVDNQWPVSLTHAVMSLGGMLTFLGGVFTLAYLVGPERHRTAASRVVYGFPESPKVEYALYTKEEVMQVMGMDEGEEE